MRMNIIARLMTNTCYAYSPHLYLWNSVNYRRNLSLNLIKMSEPSSVPTVTFNNGQKFPTMGLGTWQTEGDEMVKVIKTAIDVGYRMIDTAYIYRNEKIVGEAIKSKISEGIVKREDIFITTKLWITDHHPTQIIPACKRSLENLGVDYVDLYLVHWPMGFKNKEFEVAGTKEELEFDESVTIEEKWEKMEECVKLGLTKSIGLSNFNSQQIDRILKVAKIKPVTNQVECHPYFNQKKLIQFCKERDIIITAYAPLGSPNWPENPFVEKIPKVIDDPIVKKIADKHKKTAGQVILRYLIELGTIPIPKSSNPQRLAENINIFDFNLDSQDITQMDSLNKNLRAFTVKFGKSHKDYPFNIEF